MARARRLAHDKPAADEFRDLPRDIDPLELFRGNQSSVFHSARSLMWLPQYAGPRIAVATPCPISAQGQLRAQRAPNAQRTAVAMMRRVTRNPFVHSVESASTNRPGLAEGGPLNAARRPR